MSRWPFRHSILLSRATLSFSDDLLVIYNDDHNAPIASTGTCTSMTGYGLHIAPQFRSAFCREEALAPFIDRRQCSTYVLQPTFFEVLRLVLLCLCFAPSEFATG
jgi:hypothetical protein